jgi:hypothetical protein
MTNFEPNLEPTVGADRPRRRTPDLFTMATGLGVLAVSGIALFGGITWLPTMDVRWVLAAVAMLVGLLLVISSMRPRR